MRGTIIFSHPHGPPFVKAAVRALVDSSYSTTVVTSIGFHEKGNWRSGPGSIGRLLRRRWIPTGADIVRAPWNEFVRVALQVSGLREIFGIREQELVDRVYLEVGSRAARLVTSEVSAVYGYEDGSLELFREAQRQGVPRVYDLPIMHWKRATEAEQLEAKRYPEIASSLLTKHDSAVKRKRKDEELELASRIVVASSLTKDSVVESGVNQDKVKVIPYGVSLPRTNRKKMKESCFRVLFVGRVGARKGVHRLLSVWNELQLKDAQLLIVGGNEFPRGYLERALGSAQYLGYRSGRKLSELYHQADLFVLPSLVEGFGLVLLEALAHGLPILGSDHTAAPELAAGGFCGWSFPHDSLEALRERLLHAYLNRDQLFSLREEAEAVARMYSWDRYQQSIASLMDGVVRGEV